MIVNPVDVIAHDGRRALHVGIQCPHCHREDQLVARTRPIMSAGVAVLRHAAICHYPH